MSFPNLPFVICHLSSVSNPPDRLNERQRRHRRSVGAQDARAERKPHHVRHFKQRRPLVLRQNRLPDRPAQSAASFGGTLASAATGSATSASSSQKMSQRPDSRAARTPDKRRRLGDLRQH